ncbi:MAG: Tol-Pal system beta propeller repeat protein TolB [Elusimicrobia bacterium]|nr:Tol-Pal system beta propeller repeat protein TolB [Elusimicrobiota bacterium]
MKAGYLAFFLLACQSSGLFGTDIYLQIQRGEKLMIALPDFRAKNNSERDMEAAEELKNVTRSDLLFSRVFNLIEEGPMPAEGKIDFESWKKNGADILITANVLNKEPDKLQMIASVYEVETQKPIFQKMYSSNAENSSRIAHEFVADLLYRFTGQKGLSTTKLSFSNNSTGVKEVYLVDFDGTNLKRITTDNSLAILPRWSPEGKEIIYTSYKRNNPDLYIYSLENGTNQVFSSRKGLNSSASFSPDGKVLVATLSHEGYPNLYLLNRKGEILQRLTHGKFADTSASFSPDGKRIIFVSDRPGWPQIYVIDTDGSNLKRLSDSGYCDSPIWSPQGDKIAYSRGTNKGIHEIVIHDLISGEIVQITNNQGSNENPTFSPDGQYLAFSSNRNQKREIYISSLDGSAQKKLMEMAGDSFTPSWGP